MGGVSEYGRPVVGSVAGRSPGLVGSVLGLVPGRRTAPHTGGGEADPKGWVPKPRRRVRQPTQAWGVLGTEEPGEEAGNQEDGEVGSVGELSLQVLSFPQDMEKERETLQAWKERLGQELDRVVAFWMEHSHDQDHGGFFTCLGRNGKVYDDLKYVWLQGRQVRMC